MTDSDPKQVLSDHEPSVQLPPYTHLSVPNKRDEPEYYEDFLVNRPIDRIREDQPSPPNKDNESVSEPHQPEYSYLVAKDLEAAAQEIQLQGPRPSEGGGPAQGQTLAKSIPKIRVPGPIRDEGEDKAQGQALEAAAQRVRVPRPIDDDDEVEISIPDDNRSPVPGGIQPIMAGLNQDWASIVVPLHEAPVLAPWLEQKELTPEEAWEESVRLMQWESGLMRADAIVQTNYFTNEIMGKMNIIFFIIFLSFRGFHGILFHIIGISLCLCWYGLLRYWQQVIKGIQKEIESLEKLLPEKKLKERWRIYSSENIYEYTKIDIVDWYLRRGGHTELAKYRLDYWRYRRRMAFLRNGGILFLPFMKDIWKEDRKYMRVIDEDLPYLFVGLHFFGCLFKFFLDFL